LDQELELNEEKLSHQEPLLKLIKIKIKKNYENQRTRIFS
jgi:hypothetical protein